jgi:hypothetical protein
MRGSGHDLGGDLADLSSVDVRLSFRPGYYSRSIRKGSARCPTFRSANSGITSKGVVAGGLAYAAHCFDC